MLLVYLLSLFMVLTHPQPRQSVLQSAYAHWNLGAETASSTIPLNPSGQIERPVSASGPGALPGSSVARLTDGYFNAGNAWTVRGNQITVYLRARDPRGLWSYGLLNKLGSHEIETFNLFSVDLGGTPGPDIGFELHTEAGFCMVSFPVSRIDPMAWHDFVGRYDGKTLALYCDGRLMARQVWRGNLTQNQEPVLIGAESINGNPVRPFTGELEEAAVWSRALADKDLATLMRKETLVSDLHSIMPYDSPVQYRPAFARLADTIPFYWKGNYHVFYLHSIDKVSWEHIVSKDLIHWKELPTALKPDGAPDGPDGMYMFTGSVIERHGTFHIFYTGWNIGNPQGREFIMHATSPDLIHWTKHPEDILAPDGVHYSNQRERDFRDPYVFWNATEQQYFMVFCSGEHTGLATSPDLKQWTQQPPILSDYTGIGTPECPDMFSIGAMHYLVMSPTGTASTVARHSDNIRGPYMDPVSRAVDTPILYAAKRMFDGKRHILTGWLRDLGSDSDDGTYLWGGTQCIPREIHAGPDGQLFFRPIPEALAVFTQTALDIKTHPVPIPFPGGWAYEGAALVGTPTTTDAHCRFDVPTNYLLQCRIQLAPHAVFTLGFREQNSAGTGYHLTLRPDTQEAEISSPVFHFPRRILLDTTHPITLRAFVQGTTIECFINDAFAFSCRAYDFPSGRLALHVSGGTARVLDLSVKTPRK